MDRQIGPYLKIEMQGIYGPPNRSVFQNLVSGIHGPPNCFVFLSLDSGVHGPPNWSEFQILVSGIHGPPKVFVFLSLDAGNSWIAESVGISKFGYRDPWRHLLFGRPCVYVLKKKFKNFCDNFRAGSKADRSCNTFLKPTPRILLCFTYITTQEGTKTCHT